MTEPDEVGWRVRAGVGLVMHAPFGDERKALIDRETEKERKAAEFEAEQRREAALEHRWELQRRGTVAHSVGDVLAASAVAQDRQDRRDKAAEARAAEVLGHPEPRLNRWESEANIKAMAQERETTPATQAELRHLEDVAITGITGLEQTLGKIGRFITGKRI